VEEGDLAVEVDGLRAAANSPHGVVKGEVEEEEEEDDEFRTAGVSEKDHYPSTSERAIQELSATAYFVHNVVQILPKLSAVPETITSSYRRRPPGHADADH